ncbi:unnamed protein product [Rhizophagus irregularis]|nr:unnamed protein product [Rhizophagus irregularis]
MNILNYRSSYLRSILSTIERRNDGTLIQIKLSNILPEIFQIILRYIYGGSLPLEEYDALDIIKILIFVNKKLSDEMPQYQENYGRAAKIPYKKNYAQAAKIPDNSAQVPRSQAAEQKEEAEYLRRTTSSGGRGMPKMAEQMSRSGSSRQHQSPDGWSTVGSSSQRNKEKVGDLTKFGSVNRSKIVSLAPGDILGGLSGGAKGWSKSDNKDQNDKPVGLNRANSTTNIYSVLNSESSEGRKSSESNSSYTQKPSPPIERKKLILAPRTKSFTPEEPVKLASSSQTTVELDSKKICKSIVNMVEEYFLILDSQEVITCLKEDTPVGYHPKAIETFANKVIEKKQKDVDDIMKLFKEIVSSSTCDNDAFKDGFKATLEFLMDIGADAPMAYSYTGQLLFSTELSFRDIIELLKPLDDDMAIDKIVKGYAKALKNDVDEQKYVQKINEFDLTSLFPKKNKDDINKYIEDLGGVFKKINISGIF